MRKIKCCEYGTGAVFTTLHFLCLLSMFQISQSVYHFKAFLAQCNVTIWLNGPMHKLRRKIIVLNIVLIFCLYQESLTSITKKLGMLIIVNFSSSHKYNINFGKTVVSLLTFQKVNFFKRSLNGFSGELILAAFSKQISWPGLDCCLSTRLAFWTEKGRKEESKSVRLEQ